ncbi:phage late control D family protein [Alicyclobacillus acidoterrestris]|uniref:Uncharacterized protein n=1 Tax=Alicyclobacillus acidoterrestris (strain ATCC 49025 / DSM 3922 / CIP 106132 / NCIMB 13137 / GD3B) TaxID=1356854 RepID=A0A9E7CVA1_ALIAG|nr:phage late control D family protein [Alicyclobacillus acidoterrestris]UNO48053.1 hypothetical protein K1I37_15375 [Alicyclobacillus acidoterrestris]
MNGVRVPFHTWSVDLNGYGAADSFTLDVPFRILSELAGTTELALTPDFESDLFANPDILVEIYVGYPDDPSSYNTSDLTRIMYGYMDTLDVYLSAQNTTEGYYAELQGRNQIAPFMDTDMTNKYPNLTSSAIVSTLAEQHGLSTQITPTYTTAGTYYKNDNTSLTSSQSQWDLIMFLANQEGFIANVSGNTLFFGPQSKLVASKPVVYTWGENIYSLTLSRAPHASRDIKVTVYSWQPGKKTRISGTAEQPSGYIPRVGTNINQRAAYQETYYVPGLTKQQATQRAESILQQLSMTEITGEFTSYGNPIINEYQPVQFKSVGKGIDGVTFWPTKATHTFTNQNGTTGFYGIDVTFSNLLLPSDPGGD